ncbi:hypothetical protein [Modicisalibacter luteus]|uniref:Uncharacterized protein n=1 Tax=Modicisalibacter luteus TaxID=453962 RepID=A0ABV7M5V1_9GAMM|nr:hypothetical protein [Halomonas lutea]GHB15556.1 hypothetical protein GCM10007159_42300 [Halomonas lutea]
MTKQEHKWDASFDDVDVSNDAFVSRDQPLERLKVSVRQYARPFEPVGVEDWAALDLDDASPIGDA